jgi:hypothetical protein
MNACMNSLRQCGTETFSGTQDLIACIDNMYFLPEVGELLS